MKVLTDITPTKETECVFRVKNHFCSVKGDLRYCVPMLIDETCPHCVGIGEFLNKSAEEFKADREE